MNTLDYAQDTQDILRGAIEDLEAIEAILDRIDALLQEKA